MLEELLIKLMNAQSKIDQEAAYKDLEAVGVDRYTASVLAKELKQELEAGR